MFNMTKRYTLFKEIIKLSVAKNWEIAKKEWKLDHIYTALEAQTCLCGHHPIIEICVIKNLKNNEHTFLGNCCIKVLLGIGSNKMFNSLKKIREDIRNSINKPLITFLFEKGVLSEKETIFYLNVCRKRKFSVKQATWKIDINQKILTYFDKKTQA